MFILRYLQGPSPSRFISRTTSGFPAILVLKHDTFSFNIGSLLIFSYATGAKLLLRYLRSFMASYLNSNDLKTQSVVCAILISNCVLIAVGITIEFS